MIFQDEDALARHIKIGLPLPCYYIYGDDDYQKRRYLHRLEAMTVGAEGYNLQRYQGAVPVDEIANALFEISFAGGRRCIVADDMPLASLAENERKKLEQLLRELPELAGSGVLIFCFTTVNAEPKRTGKEAKTAAKFASLQKLVDKVGGGVIRLDPPSRAELAGMLERSAEKRGCKAERALCQYMIARCGDDVQTLAGEMQKLADYSGGGAITREMVDLVTVATPTARIYDLAAKVLGRDFPGAFAVLDELLTMREEPTSILRTLSGAYLDLFRAKTARQEGITAEDIAKDYPKNYARREFVLRNAFRDQQKMSAEALQNSLGILLDGELRMKSTRADNEIILQETLARLFTAMERR